MEPHWSLKYRSGNSTEEQWTTAIFSHFLELAKIYKIMLRPSLKDAALEERRGRACPRIGHEKKNSAENWKCHIQSERTQEAERFCHGTCSLRHYLGESNQGNHQGYRHIMKLKSLELLKEMFWRSSSVRKNIQLSEFFQTIYDNHGSASKFFIRAELWKILPRLFAGRTPLRNESYNYSSAGKCSNQATVLLINRHIFQ